MIRRAFRRWRPIQLPPLRDCIACVFIYASLFALGFSMATGNPWAALVFAACLLVLSLLLDRKPKGTP